MAEVRHAFNKYGGEIGRAQALQALACGLAPHTDFNPVLLKPTTDRKAQVIIHGKVAIDLDAKAYHDYKPRAMQAVLASWARLTAQYDCVLVEGAALMRATSSLTSRSTRAVFGCKRISDSIASEVCPLAIPSCRKAS